MLLKQFLNLNFTHEKDYKTCSLKIWKDFAKTFENPLNLKY